MPPYTPLHHLLLRDLNRPLVMTSGNRRDEPIARTNDDAREHLAQLADAFLLHDRPIHNRNDDSVIFVADEHPVPIRRSRGYAPEPIQLAFETPEPVLALGSFMKNTFCLLARDKAFLSQHIGEMDDVRVWDFQIESIRRYLDLFGVRPARISHDLHPDFAQTADAILAQLPGLADLPRTAVQHHHAHIAACLAENRVAGPVIGLAWDGTGYGPDGTIWGGEFLVVDLADYRRVGRFAPFALPGNEAAIREPWRIAVGLLSRHDARTPGETDEIFASFAPLREINVVAEQARRGLNSPRTSSAGRLFDAMAALIGLRTRVTYEGQAAMELETLARTAPSQPAWAIDVSGATLLTRENSRSDAWDESVELERNTIGGGASHLPLYEIPSQAIMQRALANLRSGVAPAVIAARFHQTLIAAAAALVERIAADTGLREVALSGGCFLNRILLTGLTDALRARGFTIYTHRHVPPGDGGIALGQAAITAHTHRSPLTEYCILIMCLAVPAKILQITPDQLATVDFGGVQRVISVQLLPQARPGDYVLIHTGFAIGVIDEEEARITLDMLAEMGAIASTPTEY
jgi:hydrogenase maturation protein HypF